VLASLIGLERQLCGKSAGLRTQAIVGTSAALIVLVSKYGFGDVLASGRVVLDPSRVAAQIVSGVGFLGAGLILTRQGAVRGLTTAAVVWETAAIGMAAGAGLPLLAASTSAGWAVSDLTSGDARTANPRAAAWRLRSAFPARATQVTCWPRSPTSPASWASSSSPTKRSSRPGK
jgi:uncharacterized membrane protein YhiD involved in acid resistance